MTLVTHGCRGPRSRDTPAAPGSASPAAPSARGSRKETKAAGTAGAVIGTEKAGGAGRALRVPQRASGRRPPTEPLGTAAGAGPRRPHRAVNGALAVQWDRAVP